MGKLIEPAALIERSDAFFAKLSKRGSKDALHPKSALIMREVLQMDSIQRRHVPELTGLSERHSRNIVRGMINAGVLMSSSTKAPFLPAFPIKYADDWFPTMFAPP